MPIKTQEEIHDFFCKDTNKKLYFHINHDISKTIQNRVKAWYPFIDNWGYRNNKVLKLVSLLCGKIQIFFGVNRLKNSSYAAVYNGWSYFSIPSDFACYLLEQRKNIEKTFRYTLASDEVFVQTVAMNSEYRERIYGMQVEENPLDTSKYYQDWERGKPYTFKSDDYTLLLDNSCFWARKFDENIDKEIVDMIYAKLKEKSECVN